MASAFGSLLAQGAKFSDLGNAWHADFNGSTASYIVTLAALWLALLVVRRILRQFLFVFKWFCVLSLVLSVTTKAYFSVDYREPYFSVALNHPEWEPAPVCAGTGLHTTRLCVHRNHIGNAVSKGASLAQQAFDTHQKVQLWLRDSGIVSPESEEEFRTRQKPKKRSRTKRSRADL